MWGLPGTGWPLRCVDCLKAVDHAGGLPVPGGTYGDPAPHAYYLINGNSVCLEHALERMKDGGA
jgi:hypothetical protein